MCHTAAVAATAAAERYTAISIVRCNIFIYVFVACILLLLMPHKLEKCQCLNAYTIFVEPKWMVIQCSIGKEWW